MFHLSKTIYLLGFLFFLQFITLSCKQTAANQTSNSNITQSYTCGGNEPFWMVKIDADRVLFKTPDNEVVYPSADFRKEGETMIFETMLAHATMSSKLKVTFLNTKCTDSMSGFESPYTVTLERDGETYTGCGRAN